MAHLNSSVNTDPTSSRSNCHKQHTSPTHFALPEKSGTKVMKSPRDTLNSSTTRQNTSRTAPELRSPELPQVASNLSLSTRSSRSVDWAHVPLITGPMYLIVNTVYVICDCTLTEKWLSIVPRDTSYWTIKIKVKKLIEFKMLNFLHYFDHYLLELVLQGDVDEAVTGATSFSSPTPNASLTPDYHFTSPSEGKSPTSVGPNARHSSSGTDGDRSRPKTPQQQRHSLVSPTAKFAEMKSLPQKRRSTLQPKGGSPHLHSPHPFHSRRSVWSKGHPGGKGYSIVTLKALDGERFFDWVEALEDVRDVSAMPHDTQPIVQPTEPHLRPEYPVFGQKFYALA